VSDKRHEHRTRVLKPARIVLNGGHGACDCLVRSLSPAGALLQIPGTLGIETRFELDIDDSTGPRPCTVTWRGETLMGVVFDDAFATQAPGESSSTRRAETASSDLE